MTAVNSNLTPFVDVSGQPTKKPAPWVPYLIPKEAIDAEIERLANIAMPANGRRAASIVHPLSATGVLGLTPATDVTINVLKPGERTVARRQNANLIEICLQGTGSVAASQIFHTVKHDVWNIPSMAVTTYENTGRGLWVRLSYSNAPLLEKMGVLFAEEGNQIREEETERQSLTAHQASEYVRERAPDYEIGSEGARLRGYEFLTDIEVVENKALLWPWAEVAPHLSAVPGDGKRGIYLLYNPLTERRNGTSNSFFATWGGCPPGTPPFTGKHGHRHSSASINYHTRGYGSSIVDGVDVAWKAGDLLFSAPSWSEHAHYHGPEGWTVLTVQDHPMHIALGSLLWQEQLYGPIFSLGLESGQKGYVSPRGKGA